jgi:hypothetical protein
VTSNQNSPDDFAEFDSMLADIRESAEGDLARLQSPPSGTTALDPAGFITEWPEVSDLIIEDLR